MTTKRLVFLVLILLVPFTVMAQDSTTDERGDIEIFGGDIEIFGGDIEIFGGDIEIFGSLGDIAYTWIQEGSSGTLTATENGRYVLSLMETDPDTLIVQLTPPRAIEYSTEQFIDDWSTAIGLSDEGQLSIGAQLDVGGDTLLLEIFSATFDSMTNETTYIVDVVGYVPNLSELSYEELANLDVTKFEPPTQFDVSKLTLIATADFWDSLQSGANVRRVNMRAGEDSSCDQARNEVIELQTAYKNETDTDAKATIYDQILIRERWIADNCNA